jgi:putative inorganic carbon (hco3(-)) transporter
VGEVDRLAAGQGAVPIPGNHYRFKWRVLDIGLCLVEWGLLLGVAALLASTPDYRPYLVIAPAGLLLATGLRWLRTGTLIPTTALNFAWSLFILSAVFSIWVAYDRPIAILIFFRILTTGALYFALVSLHPRYSRKSYQGSGSQPLEEDHSISVEVVAWLPVLFATALAVYWPVTNDFTLEPGKYGLITQIGTSLNSLIPPDRLAFLPVPNIHGNTAGGTLALAVPLALGLLWSAVRSRRLLPGLLAPACLAVILGGLLLTSSRGSWIGCLAAVGLCTLAYLQRRLLPGRTARVAFWLSTVSLVLVLTAGLVSSGYLETLLGKVPDPNGSLQGRPLLWKQSLSLIRDYPLTGIGLGNYFMVYSTYTILMHTPILGHSHNIFLEVWIEQGILGALALLICMVVCAQWSWRALTRKYLPPLAWAALASLMVIAVHGIFDVVFYVKRTLPLVGLAAGLAAYYQIRPLEPRPALNKVYTWTAAGAVILFLVLPPIHRPLLAVANANMGAVWQTRTELSLYDPNHFDNPTMDLIRRTADLSLAEAYYQQALALQPVNRTTLQRLAGLALSRGQYARALELAQAAYLTGPQDEISRMLYSDALISAGQVEQAAALVDGLEWAWLRIKGQAWYRYWLGVPPRNPDYPRAAYAWSTALLLNPADQDSRYWLEVAQEAIGR